jgi:hypothetical protein
MPRMGNVKSSTTIHIGGAITLDNRNEELLKSKTAKAKLIAKIANPVTESMALYHRSNANGIPLEKIINIFCW